MERRTTRKIEGVINDAAGQKAMDVLVNQMVPLTPKGSGNWFIDEVNAAIGQGKVCVGFQWIAAIGGLLDPEQSELGKTQEEILEKLGFAPLPKQDTDLVPLGGMGMHVSKYIPEEKQAEALNFIKWFQTPEAQKKWARPAACRRVTTSSRRPSSSRPRRTTRCSRTRSRACGTCGTCPSTRSSSTSTRPHVNAAINGAKEPEAALDKIAADEQAMLDESGD